MQKYYTVFSYVLALTLMILAETPKILPQKPIPTPSPLQQCWEINFEGTSKAETASDNVQQVFIADLNGAIASINSEDGSRNWTSELGGDILSVNFRQQSLYVVSSGADRGLLTFRALGVDTGITKWQKALPVKLPADNAVSNSNISLIPTDDFIFLVTGSELYKLSADRGEELEKVDLGENITTKAQLFGQKLFVGTDRKNILVYSIPDRTLTKTAIAEIPTALYVEAEVIIVGDRLGKLTALKTTNGKKDWQIRVGAEISDFVRTDKGLAVSSKDNFLYLIAPKNGSKIWKKRFTDRTAAAIDVKADSPLVVVNLNGSVSALIEVKSGKIINQLVAPAAVGFSGKPVFINGFIIYKTNTGLISYSSSANCIKKERPELPPGL